MLLTIKKPVITEQNVEVKLPYFSKTTINYFHITEDGTVIDVFLHNDYFSIVAVTKSDSYSYTSRVDNALEGEEITATAFWFQFEQALKNIQNAAKLTV